MAYDEKVIKISSLNQLNLYYKDLREIGRGTFGIVYKSIEKETNETKALKYVRKSTNINFKKKLLEEINLLQMIDHPNIIRLEKVYETNQKLCLVLEYCPRKLATVFEERKILKEDDVHSILKNLSSAIAYLHFKGIVHRDLKLENILLTSNLNDPNDEWFIKIIDFGLSAIQTNNKRFLGFLNTFCGTLQYMAPELATKSYGKLCDIWSMGVIMYVLLSGKFPYILEETDMTKINEVLQNTYIDYESINCSPAALNLLKHCLETNPVLRLSAYEVTKHPWILRKPFDETEYDRSNIHILALMDQANDEKIKMKDILATSKDEKRKAKLNDCNDNQMSLVQKDVQKILSAIIPIPLEPSDEEDNNIPKITIVSSRKPPIQLNRIIKKRDKIKKISLE